MTGNRIPLRTNLAFADKAGEVDRTDVGKPFVLAECGEDFAAIHGRHHDVEHHEVGSELTSDLDGLGGIVERDRLVQAGPLKEPNYDTRHGRFVVADQDALLLRHPLVGRGVHAATLSVGRDSVNLCYPSTYDH